MGKSRTDRNGLTREQRLFQENRVLKRQIQKLNKKLARIDLDRYEQVREIIEEHCIEENKNEGQEILEKMKQEWKCHECDTGYLEIIVFNKINDVWYMRRCNNCLNRTKSQKYDPKIVKGILKE